MHIGGESLCVATAYGTTVFRKTVVRNALNWTHDIIDTSFGQSGKVKDKFKAIVTAEGEGPALSIRPLCPTRWTVPSLSICAVLSQYGMILSAVDEMVA